MKSFLFLLTGIIMLNACKSNKGWTQADLDKLIKSCKDKALSTGGLAGTDMGKASPQEITQQAAACIDMIK